MVSKRPLTRFLLFPHASLAAGRLTLQITGAWKKAFQSIVENPSFQHRAKSFNTTKIGVIKKQPIDVKNLFDIEVYVLKSQSTKRDMNGETKSDFFIVGDASSFIWLRSSIELEEKRWYTISSIKTMQINDEILLATSQYSIKADVNRNDVDIYIHCLHFLFIQLKFILCILIRYEMRLSCIIIKVPKLTEKQMNNLEKIVLSEETTEKVNINSIKLQKAGFICGKCGKSIDHVDNNKITVMCGSCKTASRKDSCRIVNDVILSIEYGNQRKPNLNLNISARFRFRCSRINICFK